MNTEYYKQNKPASSVSCVFVLVQGNQMTLVFMEREYSSPEEPHLGIVHMVEVSSPPQTSSHMWHQSESLTAEK